MAHYIAAHTVPFDLATLVKFAKEEAPKFSEVGVSWIRTHCGFNDDKHFCEWEAPNKEAIEKIFRDLEIPYDGIYEVKVFDVATATLED